MIGILAIVFFIAAVVVHGAAFTSHINWFDWQGLMLLGFLCLAFGGGFSPPAVVTRWRKRE